MSERRFVLVDFTHMNRAGCLRLYEAGHCMPFHEPSPMLRLARTRRQTAATGLGGTKYVSATKGADRDRGDRGGSGIEGAATACSRNSRSRSIDTLIWAALIRISSYAQTLDGAPPVSPASMRGPFSPTWLPLPCFQKILESVLPARFYRHSKSPTAMALVGLPFASRRPNNRLG